MAEGKKGTQGTSQGKKAVGQKANGQTPQTQQPKKQQQQKKPAAAAAEATPAAATPAAAKTPAAKTPATKAPAAPKAVPAKPKVAEKRKRDEATDVTPAEKKAKGTQGQAVKKGKKDNKKGKQAEKVEEAVAEVPAEKKKRQKPRRCLTLGSRGMIAMERYLMNDLRSLMPHHKVESKLEKKHDPGEDLMEMAELKHCDHVLYLENRKRKDTYMYLGEAPNGPTAKFLCRAIHTMAELKMTGNCIKGSRPFLHFDGDFDTVPHLKLLKPLITNIFGTQQHHPNSKPFIDHVFCFFHLDGRVWFRNYQIVEERISKKEVKRSLLEVGPRFAIEPIRILSGPFVGHTLFKNEAFQSPNAFRAEQRKKAEARQREREAQKAAEGEAGEGAEDAEGADEDEE